MRVLLLLGTGAPVLLSACTKDSPTGPSDNDAATMAPLDLLNRLSLDLRGVRPSEADITAVVNDPSQVDVLMDGYLHDERFGQRVRDLWSEVYLTRSDLYPLGASSFGLDDDASFKASIGEEPLYVLSTIADEDRPYGEIVTGDWTVVNEQLAAAYHTDYPEGGTGWQVAHYTDGRPAAGVLGTNGLWWRYESMNVNYNRGRANALSKILLCNDYLLRPIEFDRNINILDQDAVNDAVKTNPGCVNCHSSLDPLASYLFGFWHDQYSATDASVYHPERERLYLTTNGTSPGYYGEPGYTMTDLGHQIEADPRFVECAVEQTYELLLRRDSGLDDSDALTAHREDFLASGLQLRALIRSVLTDERYRAPADDSLAGGVPRKMLTPDLLASLVEDITGYRWTYAGYDMLQTDTYGLRTLAGGVDGFTVTRNATQPNATLFLVQERLAEGASTYVFDTEAAQARADRRLFTEVDFDMTPATDPDAMARQLQRLHLLVFGQPVELDGPEVQANLDLWQKLYDAEGDGPKAWSGLLSALLRDPDFLFY